MQVILIENVDKLGRVGETVRVRDGYARNYLIPHKKALRATNDNIAYFEAKKADFEAQNKTLTAEAEKKAKKIDGQHVVLVRQASEDGRLYGSVNSKDIVDAIKGVTGEDLLRRHIDLNSPIKSLGIYQIRVVPHGDVSAVVEVNVARSESEAKEAREADKAAPSETDFLEDSVVAANKAAEEAEAKAAEEEAAAKAAKASKKAAKVKAEAAEEEASSADEAAAE